MQTKLSRKTYRKRAIRFGLVLSNAIVLAIILFFVLQNPKTSSLTPTLNSSAEPAAVANPVDQVSSADIALTVARMNSLPETVAINNQAQSQEADAAITASHSDVVNKPQVVVTGLKSKADIQIYVSKSGDTLSSLAQKFGVTSDSIRWSNNLNVVDAIPAGTQLIIPPVNGMVYTVKPGDTPASLADRFRSNKAQIIAYNDAEISGLRVGERIIIPNAVKTVTGAAATAGGISSGGFAWGTSPIYGYNGYDYGYCTWYVATQVAVPANWGNANSWDYYARMSGWSVSGRPAVGSIAQSNRGSEGHVAVVDAVSADGRMIQYRDMNGIAGWGNVGQSIWVPASRFDNYIGR